MGYSRGLPRVDESESLTLDNTRHSLIRQEDSIIFNLLERAQYCYNADTYDEDAFTMEGFQGSLVEFMVGETEKLHAKVQRVLMNILFSHNARRSLSYPDSLPTGFASRKKVWNMYFKHLPTLVKPGDDGRTQLIRLLMYETVEEVVNKRVEIKTKKFRSRPNDQQSRIWS